MADATSMTTSGSPPVTGGSQQINVRQNEPFAIDLLKATDVAYAKAQRWEFARAVVALSLSAGSLAAATVRDLAPIMTVIGLGGAVAQWLMGYIGQSGSIFAAKLQERLDTYLFDLPVTVEFKPLPSDEEVDDMAGRYHGSHTKRDWYVDVTSLPRPYAILLCQRENLQWDWPLRRKWASLLRGSQLAGSCLG